MWFCRYFIYFIIFSAMGWIYESLFCTIKSGKWKNRGFLFGPVCPIYGAGAVGITAVSELIGSFTTWHFVWWQVFLVSFFGSIVLEYFTSWILEKLFHAYWWDYSNVPLNIHGRVCLPASIGFGCAGLLVVYVIAPFVMDITGWIPPIGMEIFALFFMAVLSADITLTVSALTNLEHTVYRIGDAVNTKMELVVDSVQEKKQSAEERLAEERAKFSWENLEQVLQSSGLGSRFALDRVKGFRYPRLEKGKMEELLQNIRNRGKRKG